MQILNMTESLSVLHDKIPSLEDITISPTIAQKSTNSDPLVANF